MDLLLVAVIFLGLICLITLHEHGKAYEWVSDYDNQRKLRKCFGQEGIQIFIHDHDRSVSVTFSHKGASYSKLLTYVKAYELYRENPKGNGLRQKMVEMFK